VKEVAEAIGRSVRAVRELRKKHHQTGTTQDKPRSGRLPILSLNRKKITYRAARKAPKIEYSELAKVAVFVDKDGTSSKPPSRSTLYRCLKGRGLGKFPCKFRPKLDRTHTLKRLQFYKDFQWGRRTLKFSDECSVQKGAEHNREWYFPHPWEEWKPAMITGIGTSRKPAQIVWASVWLDERGVARRS
jgi:hypothetical protein